MEHRRCSFFMLVLQVSSRRRLNALNVSGGTSSFSAFQALEAENQHPIRVGHRDSLANG